VPKYVELRSELPTNAVGKALRRQLIADELAKEEIE
jgi:acyl-CoA synthetase (AMP-forming)/AMP-acid ligase II